MHSGAVFDVALALDLILDLDLDFNLAATLSRILALELRLHLHLHLDLDLGLGSGSVAMAQVCDVPRYRDRTLNRVMFFCCISPKYPIVNWARIGQDHAANKKYDEILSYLAMVDSLEHGHTGESRYEDPDEEEMFTRFCIQNLGLRHSPNDFCFTKAVSTMLCRIFNDIHICPYIATVLRLLG